MGGLRIKHLLVVAISLCMMLTLLALGCGPAQSEPSPEPPQRTGMEVELSLSDPPVLGKAVQLTFVFSIMGEPKWTASDVTAQIILPNGFELVDGELEWHGDVVLGTPYEIKATIRAVRLGDWKIEAPAFWSPYPGDCIGDRAKLYISVFEDSATVSDIVPSIPGIRYIAPGEYPIIVRIKPSPPLPLDEPYKLWANIKSSQDVAEAEAYLEFCRKEATERVKVPLEDILVKGELTWQGSLEKDIPVQITGTIKFPEEGDWEITAYSSCGERTAVPMHSILLHVGKEESSFMRRRHSD